MVSAENEFPKWMYGPNNQSRIFQKDEQIPKGWMDHPEKVGKKQKNEPDTAEAERVAAIKELRDNGVTISDNASIDEINAAIDKLTQGAG